MATLERLIKFAKLAGCNKFLMALERNNLLRNVTELMKQGKHVSIFCPLDTAYGKIVIDDKNMLLNHIAVKYDKYGMMYQTLSGGKISFNPAGKDLLKVINAYSTFVANIKIVLTELS